MGRAPKNRNEKRCPSCGRVFPLVDEHGKPIPDDKLGFYVFPAPRTHKVAGQPGKRLGAYCRECVASKNRELLERQNPSSPDYDPDLHERQKAYKRRWIRKRRGSTRDKPGGVPQGELSQREAGLILGVSHTMVGQWQADGTLPRPLTRAAVEGLRQQREADARERERRQERKG